MSKKVIDLIPKLTSENSNKLLSILTREELIYLAQYLTKTLDIIQISDIEVDSDFIEEFNTLIQGIKEHYITDSGLISYYEVKHFVSRITDLLDTIRDDYNAYDYMVALKKAELILLEGIRALNYADDSNGDIGSLLSYTIDMVEEIIDSSMLKMPRFNEVIFNELINIANNDILSSWDEFKISIYNLCKKYCDNNILFRKLRTCLENELDNSNSSYHNERVLLIIYDLLINYGDSGDALSFIKDNIQYTEFREIYINHLLINKSYSLAIKYCLDGEDKDKSFFGLVDKWKKLRYLAYKGLKEHDSQKELGKELLLLGNIEYYDDLYLLSNLTEDEFYNSLLQELKDKDCCNNNVYFQLIDYKNDLPALLKYLKKNNRSIEEYAKRLILYSKEGVKDIYKDYIFDKAKSASNRSKYKALYYTIKRYSEIFGFDCSKILIEELINKYPKRSALKDELSCFFLD